ncbi:hypothetical protein MHU86_13143 [Fragilaria crotonensis]|nr:hypothetical protein MHU86_13143 [Fragilaria crotonensis]
MKYSLPALAVDEEELGKIQTKIIPTIVQRLGLSSKLPTAIRHGPISMGGLGLMDLRTECGIEMLKTFRHAVHRNTEVGKLFILQVQTSQLESGIPNPILEEPNRPIPYLTPNWVLSMRQFMSNHKNITITLTNSNAPTLNSPRDKFIMFLEALSAYTTAQQRDINLVRMYLQVCTLSDMTDPQNPHHITQWAIQANRPEGFESQSCWPRQSDPSATQRRLWRRYITSQFLRYGRLWKRPPRATLKELNSDCKRDESESSTEGVATLIKRLPHGKRRLLSHIQQTVTDDTLWKALREKQSITVASDGGLKGNKGTFGWQVRSSSDEVLAEGAGPVDGPFDVANSTRCKLRWVTDSKTAISNVTKQLHPEANRSTKQPDNADYLAIIKAGNRSIRRIAKPVWIKGHQTVPTAGAISTRRTQDIISNNRADYLATWYRDQSGKRQARERTDHVDEAQISISINGKRLAKNRWSNTTWDKLDLEGLGAYHTKLPANAQITHTKFMFDQWHTGDRRHKVSAIKDNTLLLCPCCRGELETTTHVLQCKANPERTTSIKAFRTTMAKQEYHPVFRVLMISVLAWLNKETDVIDLAEFPSKFRLGLQQALQDQDKLGWEQAIKGFVSVEWRHLLTLGMGDNESEPARVGMQRLRFVLKTFSQLASSLWTARNQAHGTTEEGMKAIRQEEVAEISRMYQQPELISATDRHYCEQPLSAILKKSPASRRRWLRYMRMARARFTRDGKRQMLITSFFRVNHS